VRLAAVSLAALTAAAAAAGCGGSDTKVLFPLACANPTYKPQQIIVTCADANCAKDSTQFTHLVVTYTGAQPAAGGSTIQEDFPCKGP
jgi:hypothetical protein